MPKTKTKIKAKKEYNETVIDELRKFPPPKKVAKLKKPTLFIKARAVITRHNDEISLSTLMDVCNEIMTQGARSDQIFVENCYSRLYVTASFENPFYVEQLLAYQKNIQKTTSFEIEFHKWKAEHPDLAKLPKKELERLLKEIHLEPKSSTE